MNTDYSKAVNFDSELRPANGIETHPIINLMASHDMSTATNIHRVIKQVEGHLEQFVRPRLHGTGVLESDGTLQVEMVNNAGHDFPAMLLAALCGYSSGDVAIEMTSGQVNSAIKAMAPAEECRDFEHPNIAAWRRISERLRKENGVRAVAVFSSCEQPMGRNQIIDVFADSLQKRFDPVC